MAWGPIIDVGAIAIQTARVDESAALAQEVLGLHETARLGSARYLSSTGSRHELIYLDAEREGLDHLSLVARDETAIELIRRRVIDAGFRIVSDHPLSAATTQAVSFVGPEGFVFEVGLTMPVTPPGGTLPGPLQRYGHVNLHPTDLPRMQAFLVDVLEFRVSDTIGATASFLRCNAEHHGIALIAGRGSLHHHAWGTQSIADLARVADRLYASGGRLLWGPIRHGAGHNIAVYFREPAGSVIEVYTDLEIILDDDRPAVDWNPEASDWFTKWVDWRPEDFRKHGIDPASRRAAH